MRVLKPNQRQLVYSGFGSMTKVISDVEIAKIFAEPKPVTQRKLQILKQPKQPKNGGHTNVNVEMKGQNGRKYRIHARRSPLLETNFSVILMLRDGDELRVLARCNGHHAPHTNRIEKNVIPADTCHIHWITERYQKIKIEYGDGFATETKAYNSFDGAVDYLSNRFGIYVADDPYFGGLFRDQE